jgi:hypothetical protein
MARIVAVLVDTRPTTALGSTMPSRPAAATVLASLALVVALGVPTEGAVAHALTTRSVKKIAKKAADKEIAKKATALSVAHASNADTVGGVPASGFLPKGALTMSMSSIAWENAQPTSVTVYRMPTEMEFSAAVGLQLFAYPVAVPVQLGGAPVTLTSLRYCYEGAPGAHLTSERVTQSTFEGGTGTVVGSPIVTSPLDLADNACRTVAVNRALGPHDQISLQVSVNWSTAGTTFRLGLVTATFTPS